MEIKIKSFSELTAQELYEILQARAEVFVVEQECVYQDLDGIDQKSIHVSGYQDGELIAYLRMFYHNHEQHAVQIGRVLTRKRKKGFGLELMQAAIQAAQSLMHARQIYLEAQSYAIGFYEKAGFRVVSDEFLEDGIWHVQMTKDVIE